MQRRRDVPIRQAIMTVMVDAMMAAAVPLRRDYGEVSQLANQPQTAQEFAKRAARKATDIMAKLLQTARPKFGIVDHGSQLAERSDEFFAISAINGFGNFCRGLPHVSSGIAYVQHDQVLAGVVYDFLRDELFVGSDDQGAFLNGQRLRRGEANITSPVIGLSGIDVLASLPNLESLPPCQVLGSSLLDLMYVACERLDGYVGTNLSLLDFAPATIILTEAGFSLTDMKGKPPVIQASTLTTGYHKPWHKLFLSGTTAANKTPSTLSRD